MHHKPEFCKFANKLEELLHKVKARGRPGNSVFGVGWSRSETVAMLLHVFARVCAHVDNLPAWPPSSSLPLKLCSKKVGTACNDLHAITQKCGFKAIQG